MTNFLRVIRLSLRYRLAFASTVVCALSIGLLWGGNIAAVFPFVEVVFGGQSLQEWIAHEIDETQTRTAELQRKIDQLADPAVSPSSDAARRLHLLRTRLEAEETALALRRRLRPYINQYCPTTPFATLVVVVGALLAGTLLKGVLLAISTMLTERLAQSGTMLLRKQFYRRTLEMDIAHFTEGGTSDLISRFTFDLEQITIGLRILFGKALREPIKMAACLLGAMFISWRLLLLSLLLAPLAILLISTLHRSLKRANRRALEEMSGVHGVLGETLRSIKVVKAFTMQRHERRRFDDASRQLFRKSMRVAWFDALVRPTTEMMSIGTIGVALLAGAYLVLNEATHLLGVRISDRPLSISSIMLFFGLLAGVSEPARKLSGIFAPLQRAAAAADRIFQLYDRMPQISNPPAPQPLPESWQQLSFAQVGFHYTPHTPVLCDINLEVRRGETIAIVGPNGCGKSTLANLVPRFFDPCQGSVCLDGIDLRQFRLQDLRKRIGLVTQEPLLFNATVRDNIRYGRPSASDAQVVAAAQQARADRFIVERLEHGYDTLIGEGGGRLSGGQRQRLALARAILRDPEILILDEATSQVDLLGEREIQAILSQFIRHRTTIIITHRMSVLSLADRIVMMQSGQIVDVGSQQELLHRCPSFQHLVHGQLRASA